MMSTKQPVRGYSLLELIVSMGLFSMVMIVVMGVYLALISYDRQARATNELVSNLSFAVESMARNIRTGTRYTGGSTSVDCTASSATADGTYTNFSFCDSEGEKVHYRLNSNGSIGLCTAGEVATCGDSATPLTDTRITVSSLTFDVVGVGTTGANGLVQPFVIMKVIGTMATDAGKTIEFVIQTSASQRLLDLP